jgi:putative transferase (TIGR04331 family)
MYQLLVSAGIVHLSPVSAAGHVNRYWTDIDLWWKNDQTQLARREFTAVYARVSNRPGKDLVKLLTESA